MVPQAKVPNVDVHDGTPWTLGGYLAESGGNKRRNKLVFGLHVDQDNVDDDDMSKTIRIRLEGEK